MTSTVSTPATLARGVEQDWLRSTEQPKSTALQARIDAYRNNGIVASTYKAAPETSTLHDLSVAIHRAQVDPSFRLALVAFLLRNNTVPVVLAALGSFAKDRVEAYEYIKMFFDFATDLGFHDLAGLATLVLPGARDDDSAAAFHRFWSKVDMYGSVFSGRERESNQTPSSIVEAVLAFESATGPIDFYYSSNFAAGIPHSSQYALLKTMQANAVERIKVEGPSHDFAEEDEEAVEVIQVEKRIGGGEKIGSVESVSMMESNSSYSSLGSPVTEEDHSALVAVVIADTASVEAVESPAVVVQPTKKAFPFKLVRSADGSAHAIDNLAVAKVATKSIKKKKSVRWADENFYDTPVVEDNGDAQFVEDAWVAQLYVEGFGDEHIASHTEDAARHAAARSASIAKVAPWVDDLRPSEYDWSSYGFVDFAFWNKRVAIHDPKRARAKVVLPPPDFTEWDREEREQEKERSKSVLKKKAEAWGKKHKQRIIGAFGMRRTVSAPV